MLSPLYVTVNSRRLRISNVMELNTSEVELVGGAMGFWQSVRWVFDNLGEAIGWAMDHMGPMEAGYYANGVYNIKSLDDRAHSLRDAALRGQWAR
jgi:hypothetical protein